jgi:hypothetical protein
MENLFYLLAGVLLGLLGLFWWRGRWAADKSAFEVRQHALTDQIDHLSVALDAARAEVAGLQAAWRGEAELRASAEARAERLPALEAEVGARAAELAEVRAAAAEQRSRHAALEMQLSKEREAAGEKLALLAGGRTQARRCLSCPCPPRRLKSNNQAFLDLARNRISNSLSRRAPRANWKRAARRSTPWSNRSTKPWKNSAARPRRWKKNGSAPIRRPRLNRSRACLAPSRISRVKRIGW